MLLRELNHRVNNEFAAAMSVVSLHFGHTDQAHSWSFPVQAFRMPLPIIRKTLIVLRRITDDLVARKMLG